MKLFCAITLPAHVVRQLARLQKGVAGARWSEPEKLHITTCYFGELPDESAEMLDDELARIRMAPFELRLSGVGHFGNTSPHALWAGVAQSPDLERLHKASKSAARKAGIIVEKRDYRPHVTLAYIRGEPEIERIVKFEKRLHGFQTHPFLVDQFFMFSSWQRKNQGNLYRMEASYPLYL